MTERYGTLARFDRAETLLRAIPAARKAGYRKLAAYAPFPVPGLDHALNIKPHRIPLYALLAGVFAAAGAFGIQWYSAVIDLPVVAGGKPLNSWPAFLPVTFEFGILIAVLTTLIGMLARNRLPMPYHPVFNSEMFRRASGDGFFLLIRDQDKAVHDWLGFIGAVEIEEVGP